MASSPSTKSLRAFEAAARLGSIKAAAEQLHLSASAVSRRIQTLEDELGQLLFVRDVAGLTLTDAGRTYAEELRAIFQALDRATATVSRSTRRCLRVLAPSMIIEAITAKLAAFDEAMPKVDLELFTANGAPQSDPLLADSDIVFFWGNGSFPGWEAQPITRNTHLVPLCSPKLLPEGRLFSTEELAEHTWVIPETFEQGWKVWYEGLGLPVPTPRRIIRTGSGMLAGQLANRAGGLIIGQGFNGYPSWGITFGMQVPAHAFHVLAPDYGYCLATRAKSENADVSGFCEWFLATVWKREALLKQVSVFASQPAK